MAASSIAALVAALSVVIIGFAPLVWLSGRRAPRLATR
jgi:hypothetical protein